MTSNSNNYSQKKKKRYTWAPTGNNVHNLIEAEFDFRAGKVFRHIDSFNMNIWAFQALGAKYLGWTKKSINGINFIFKCV